MRREPPAPDTDPWPDMADWKVSLKKDWASKRFGDWWPNWADERPEPPEVTRAREEEEEE